MAEYRFTGAAASLPNEQRARIAAFRFGLGPKRGLIAKLSRSETAAFDALWAELTSPAAAQHVMIPRPVVNGMQLTEAEDMQTCCFAGRSDLISGGVRYDEMARRCAKHLEPELGFVERLVLFWANHFSMHIEKSVCVRSVVGHFERNVIRRHVLGKFSDMLKAAIGHPAMIGYLDNAHSSKTALNENLGREILELHTVGTQLRFPHRTSGYEQEDVQAMSGLLTGWNISYAMLSSIQHRSDYGQFLFKTNSHDERPQTVMGQTFSAPGQQKCNDALQWLGTHEFTAEHIATKLLRHFAFDDPPPELVIRPQAVFMDTGGDLLEVSKELLKMEEVWTAAPRLRPPHLWIMGMARGLGFTAADFTSSNVQSDWQNLLVALNNAIWSRVTPDGYPDDEPAWLHPNAIRMRVNVAIQVLRWADSRGYVLPNPDTLRTGLLPGAVRVTKPAGDLIDNTRSQIADIFLTTEFMTR